MTDRQISLKAAIAVVQDNLAFSVKAQIVKALSSLPSVEGWLGIESAPVWEDDILIMVTGGRYIPPQLIRSDGDYWRTAKLKAVPTHYMPLPAPPIE